MRKLTGRQAEILDMIKGYFDDNDRPPTMREISEQIGINHNAVGDHLKALVKKGYIKKTPGIARGIRLL